MHCLELYAYEVAKHNGLLMEVMKKGGCLLRGFAGKRAFEGVIRRDHRCRRGEAVASPWILNSN